MIQGEVCKKKEPLEEPPPHTLGLNTDKVESAWILMEKVEFQSGLNWYKVTVLLYLYSNVLSWNSACGFGHCSYNSGHTWVSFQRTVLKMRSLKAWLGETGLEKLNFFNLKKRGLRGEFQGFGTWGIVQHIGSRFIPSYSCLRGDSRPRRPLSVPPNLTCVWENRDKGTVNHRYSMSLSCLYLLVWCYQTAEHKHESIELKTSKVSVILESAFPGRQFLDFQHSSAFPLKGAHALPRCGRENVTQDHCDQHRPCWLLKTWVFSL